MYIIKNAVKCITRSKGRNVLIGIIVLVISVSACVGLSIRQAAENAKADTLANLNVTASISLNRQAMMQDMESGGGFDRTQFTSAMDETNALTLDDYEKYASAESVSDFYYSDSATLDGADGLEPFNTDSESTDSDDSEDATAQQQMNPMGGGGPTMSFSFAQGDFTLTGYSSESAMTSFINGTSYISDGSLFDTSSDTGECIINQELATFNGLAVGDTITLVNPNAEDETYALTIVGIYSTSSSDDTSANMMNMSAMDPANQIYVSYPSLASIIENSAAVATTETDSDTGMETSTAIRSNISATYVFTDVASYERFSDEVTELGLSDSYTVSSADVSAYENSLTPLNTLSTMAGYFLLVVLGIGAIILIVLNIFNVRERKYEVGVMTAIGMNKAKVAGQFLLEFFLVTIVATVLGAGIGAASSVPITNSLLADQVASQEAATQQTETNFGRGGEGMPEGMPGGGTDMPTGGFFGGATSATEYVSQVSSATDMTVLLQLLGIGITLTLIAGAASMFFIMRYEPLQILADRD